jgi:hypothetical protein
MARQQEQPQQHHQQAELLTVYWERWCVDCCDWPPVVALGFLLQMPAISQALAQHCTAQEAQHSTACSQQEPLAALCQCCLLRKRWHVVYI